MQPYLEIMAHELLHLYWHGITVTLPESLGGQQLTVRAMLLQWVCDYRGHPKCSRTTQAPALSGACYVCDQQGVSIPVNKSSAGGNVGGKTVYPGAWRDCDNARFRARGSKLNTMEGDASTEPHRLRTQQDFMDAARQADEDLGKGIAHTSRSHCAKTSGQD